VHNENVIHEILVSEDAGTAWRKIFELHKKWIALRKNENRDIPRIEKVNLLEKSDVYKRCTR